MSHRKSSSTPARWFRPTLEHLEDRIVPADLGIAQQVLNFGQGLVNSTVGLAQVAEVNLDILNFDSNPTPNNLISLIKDSVNLQKTVVALQGNVQLLNGAVQKIEGIDAVAQGLGFPPVFLSPSMKATVDSIVSAAQSTLAYYQSVAQDALLDIQLGIFVFLGIATAKPSLLPTPPATTGGYAVDYSDPPGKASASGPSVTESVTATQSPDSNAVLNVQILYAADDGTTDKTSVVQIAPNTSQTVFLTEMPCSAGFTGTFTVYIDGQVTHTASVHFTP